jgi:carotenoid cleavage dioxygenase-like enzyme
VVGRHPAPFFFAYHHLNAFEEEGTLHVDLMCYSKPSYDSLSLRELRERSAAGAPLAGEPFSSGELRRYSMPLDAPAAPAEHTVLCARIIELPRWDDRQTGRRYRFAYGVGEPQGAEELAALAPSVSGLLVKAALEARTHTTWHEASCAPGEPVFVPRPGGADEDDGVVLSVVFDNRSRASFLLVLDAPTFTEVARLAAPHGIPAGLHGQFWPKL